MLKVSFTGELLWTYNAPTAVYDSMVVAEDGIYLFNDTADNLLKVNASDGSLLWTHSNFADAPLLGSDGSLYFYRTGRVVRIDPSNGIEIWTYSAPTGFYEIPPVVVEDGIYLLSQSLSGNFRKISTSGSVLWQFTDFRGGVNTHLFVGDAGIYIRENEPTAGNTNADLIRIDPSDGTAIWTYADNAGRILLGSDGSLYSFNETTRNLVRIDPSDGTAIWTYTAPSGVYDIPVVGEDGIYLFEDNNDSLRKIGTSGSLLWTYTAPTTGYGNVIVTSNGVYLWRISGVLLKINPNNGSLIWTYTGDSGNHYAPVFVA